MNTPEELEASQVAQEIISDAAQSFRNTMGVTDPWQDYDRIYQEAMKKMKPLIEFIQDKTKAEMTQELTTIDLDQLIEAQWQWCEEMGWHNKTPLEYLALIGSEVGESVNECRGEEPTEELGTELADIILRTIDFAHEMKIDLPEKIKAKMAVNKARGTRGRLK